MLHCTKRKEIYSEYLYSENLVSRQELKSAKEYLQVENKLKLFWHLASGTPLSGYICD